MNEVAGVFIMIKTILFIPKQRKINQRKYLDNKCLVFRLNKINKLKTNTLELNRLRKKLKES